MRRDDEGVEQMDGSDIAETWQSADEYKYRRQIICTTFPIALFDLTNEEEEEEEEGEERQWWKVKECNARGVNDSELNVVLLQSSSSNWMSTSDL